MTKKLKFRDEQVAEDISKKAKLGWLDTEIIAHGCAYLDSKCDKVFYKISTCEDDIYRFMETCKLDGYYPSRIMTLKRRYDLPTGMKEIVAKTVKIELALLLQRAYPKQFFYILYELGKQSERNDAAELIWDEIMDYENSLDEKWLYCLHLLIEYALFCHGITAETYKQFQEWVANEQKCLGETAIDKHRLKKTVCGFGYEKDGKLQYVVDARRSMIYRKFYTIEAQGYNLSPIFSKQYGYNLCDDLPKVIDVFKAELKETCDITYMNKVTALRHVKVSYEKDKIEKQITEVRKNYGEDAADTLQCYAYRWGIL